MRGASWGVRTRHDRYWPIATKYGKLLEAGKTDFELQTVEPFLHWLTLIILCIMPIVEACRFTAYGGAPPTRRIRQPLRPRAGALLQLSMWMVR